MCYFKILIVKQLCLAHVKHWAKTVNPKFLIWEYRANLSDCERLKGSVEHRH